jgi:hypothetical protein
MLAEWRDRDPIDRYRERLAAEGIERETIDRVRAEVFDLVERCAERALASPMPDPETAGDGVFADEWSPLGDGRAPWSRWSDRDPGRGPGAGGQDGNGRLPLTGRGRHDDLGVAA